MPQQKNGTPVDPFASMEQTSFSNSFVDQLVENCSGFYPPILNSVDLQDFQTNYHSLQLPPHPSYRNANQMGSGVFKVYRPQSTGEISFSSHSSSFPPPSYPTQALQDYYVCVNDAEYEEERGGTKRKTKTSKGIKPSLKNPITNRNKTMKHNVKCETCMNDVGFVFVRGKKGSEDIEPTLHFNCIDCDHIGYDNTATKGKKRRKGDCSKLECEVCKSCIGSGGVVSPFASDIKVEYVCKDCGVKYLFCSECGGGGKQRTGKWRPKELFDKGRRTCSLPHIRVGSVDVHYNVIKVSEITEQILFGIQDVFFDCFLSIYCIPSVMGTVAYGSFEVIREKINKLWQTTVLDVIQNAKPDKETYITLAWIYKRHRNKGLNRKSAALLKEATPWLRRLGFGNIFSASHESTAAYEDSLHHCYVSFSISEWDPQNETVFINQIAPRSVFLKTMDGYLEMIKNTVAHIKNDAAITGRQIPQTIWCWAKSDHARLQSIPQRIRFSLKSVFLRANPHLNAKILEKPDYSPLQSCDTIEYAAYISDILRD